MTYTTIGWVAQGFTGAPGYTRFKFEGSLDGAQANARAAATRTFLAALTTYLPTGLSYTVEATAKVFTDTGVLESEFLVGTPPAAVNGAASGSYPGGVGAVVFWNTPTVWGGRKIRGRTYIVPLANAGYQSDGSLSVALRTALQDAGNTLLGGTPALVVNSLHAGSGSAGAKTAAVTSCTVPDRPAVLRSRRT